MPTLSARHSGVARGGFGGFKPARHSGVARGGVWGVQIPSIEKGAHFYCLVIEQKQWLIIKIVATKCRILRLKFTKFRFRLPLAELTALPKPFSWI